MAEQIEVGIHNGLLDTTMTGAPIDMAPSNITEILVDDSLTLGEIWGMYCIDASGDHEMDPSGVVIIRRDLPPRLVLFETLVDESGELRWFVPWRELSIASLQRVYPQLITIQRDTDKLIFVEIGGVGGGGPDFDWQALLEVYEAVLPLLEDGLTLYGAAALARDSIRVAARRIAKGVDILKTNASRWRARLAHPYNIREVLTDTDTAPQRKAQFLGLRSEEDVTALTDIMTPDDVLLKIIQEMPAKDQQLQGAVFSSINLLSSPIPFRAACGCGHERCHVHGTIYAIPHGVEARFTKSTDHFVLGNQGLSKMAVELERVRRVDAGG